MIASSYLTVAYLTVACVNHYIYQYYLPILQLHMCF